MNIQKQNGFSFIELMIVIGISGILATLGIANYFNYQRNVAIDKEGSRMVGYLREAIARARSQQDNVTWAIHIENGASDYYELLSGGATGTSIGRVYLDQGVTFTATTSSATSTLVGGLTISPVPSQINIGLTATNSSSTEEITVQTNGKVLRVKNY